jgi:hypothetical protein
MSDIERNIAASQSMNTTDTAHGSTAIGTFANAGAFGLTVISTMPHSSLASISPAGACGSSFLLWKDYKIHRYAGAPQPLSVKRMGRIGHLCSDETYKEMREVGALHQCPVRWTAILLNRAREEAPPCLNRHLLARSFVAWTQRSPEVAWSLAERLVRALLANVSVHLPSLVTCLDILERQRELQAPSIAEILPIGPRPTVSCDFAPSPSASFTFSRSV